MARLLQKTSQQVLNERIDCCRNYAKSQHLICVEKDARTVISDGEAIYINTSGNDGMATGGKMCIRDRDDGSRSRFEPREGFSLPGYDPGGRMAG